MDRMRCLWRLFPSLNFFILWSNQAFKDSVHWNRICKINRLITKYLHLFFKANLQRLASKLLWLSHIFIFFKKCAIIWKSLYPFSLSVYFPAGHLGLECCKFHIDRVILAPSVQHLYSIFIIGSYKHTLCHVPLQNLPEKSVEQTFPHRWLWGVAVWLALAKRILGVCHGLVYICHPP